MFATTPTPFARNATNRLLALGQLPSAADDLTVLSLQTADTATRAMALSTLSSYGPEGLVCCIAGGDRAEPVVQRFTCPGGDSGRPRCRGSPSSP